MAENVQSIDLKAWDIEIARSNSDLNKLYNEMLNASKQQTGADNVEILWRLAKVTYMISMNMLDTKEIKEKTLEAMQYGEKAVNKDAGNYKANLWLASAAGKMALLEDNLQQKIRYKIIAVFFCNIV